MAINYQLLGYLDLDDPNLTDQKQMKANFFALSNLSRETNEKMLRFENLARLWQMAILA